MRVLITGVGGQLGGELQRTAPPEMLLAVPGRAELDITDARAVQTLSATFRPDWIINAAGYTAVDRAESEPQRAREINAGAVRNLAQAADAQDARLLQISTDFVFDGAQGRPYRPDDAPNPLNVYAASKLEGERIASELLGSRALIVRTSWMYTAGGHNFVRTMLRLMQERDSLGVVADQVGTPTSARGLAEALWALLLADEAGIHHWSDAGVASWYDFALAIRDEALALGLLEHAVPVTPLATDEYPTPARRPPYSVLDKRETWKVLGQPAAHWRDALRIVLKEIAADRSITSRDAP